MPDRERKRVPDNTSDVLKGSLPQGPHTYPRKAEGNEAGRGGKERE